MSKKKIIKSAKDGRFASKEDLAEYPEITYQQSVEVPPRRKKDAESDLKKDFDEWDSAVSGEVEQEG